MAREVPYPLFYYYPPSTTFDVKGVFAGKFYAKDNMKFSFNSNFVRQAEDFTWLFSAKYPGAPRWWRPIKLGTIYMEAVFQMGDAFHDWGYIENLDYIEGSLMSSYILDGYRFSWATEYYEGELFPNYYGIGDDSGVHFSHPEVACHTHNYLDIIYISMICYLTRMFAIMLWVDWPMYLSRFNVLRPRRRFDYEMYIDSSKRLDMGRDCGNLQEGMDES